MQISKHPYKNVYVAQQHLGGELPPAMPSMYMAEGYTEMQAIMGVIIMMGALCCRFSVDPEKLELDLDESK